MPQSLASVLVHIVFSTKDRVPFLKDEAVRNELHAQLGGTSKTLHCPPLIVGGVADHIHLLAGWYYLNCRSRWNVPLFGRFGQAVLIMAALQFASTAFIHLSVEAL